MSYTPICFLQIATAEKTKLNELELPITLQNEPHCSILQFLQHPYVIKRVQNDQNVVVLLFYIHFL